MGFKKLVAYGRVLAVVAIILSSIRPAAAYSVVAHEAIVDRAWDDSIKPLLLRRFPGTTTEQLAGARAYAYGGCAIQDLGYYPFSSRYFSDLTHYVRSGDFINALIRDAADVDEYAFALGALSHYAADSAGHAVAINKAVPLLYPKLRSKFGDDITYEDNPSAHMQTEFGFDVIEVAGGSYASNSFHRSIGFKISRRLLNRAFFETYGIELKEALTSVDLALATYRISVSSVIPEMTRVAWEMKKDQLGKEGLVVAPARRSRGQAASEPVYTGYYTRSGNFARVTALWFRVVPRVGLFKPLGFRRPTVEAQNLYNESLDIGLARYREILGQLANGSLLLEDINLDTGLPTRVGEYRLADEAYARLVKDLAKNGFENATVGLRENILAFYAQGNIGPARRGDPASWNRTKRGLNQLRVLSR